MSALTLGRPGTSLARVSGLARSNGLLLLRNRLTLVNAVVVPLTPALLAVNGDRGDKAVGASVVSAVLMLVVLFPVYYNVLSLTVTRRDELVLKRIRTGETRDVELLVSLAIPGGLVALLVGAALVPVALALGFGAPLNLVLYALTLVAGCVLLSCLALWTASWTRNAEAAQLSSLPVICLIVLGNIAAALPDRWEEVLDFTPGAALARLAALSWFGDGPDGRVGYAASWSEAGVPLLVLVAWTVLAVALARRSFRWEPRA
jgi:ABC-2 type transport system permease protein